MKKQHVLSVMGGVNATARALGIAPPSVSEWKETIPLLRQYQLREKFPELFPANDETNKEQAA